MCGEWHEARQQPQSSNPQGQTVCALLNSLIPVETLLRASIDFGSFQQLLGIPAAISKEGGA